MKPVRYRSLVSRNWMASLLVRMDKKTTTITADRFRFITNLTIHKAYVYIRKILNLVM